jgi:hypothetical protein
MLNGFAASSCLLRGVFLLAGAAIANLAERDLLGQAVKRKSPTACASRSLNEGTRRGFV